MSGRDDATDPLLEISGLKKHFDQAEGWIDRLMGGTSPVRAVDGVDLALQEGETVAVVGESGCGKSTLAETVLNLTEPTAGSVRFDGEEIAGIGDRAMRPYRREMQMIFQDPLASLNPRQTVADVLQAPMEVHDIGSSESERREYARRLLERVGLKPDHLDRYPHQFSGGQQQRIAIARAIAVEPSLLVADEPVSALDVSVQAQILDLLSELQAELDLSILMISHDLSVVRHIADRVAVMYLGEIVETAPVDDLFDDPGHPYTESLLSAIPRIDPTSRTDRIVLPGSVPSPADPPDGCRFHTRCHALVPPADWDGDQETYRNVFTFRTRVENRAISPEAIRTRLELEGKPTDPDAVADHIVEHTLPVSIDDLPEGLADVVREAAVSVAAEEWEAAATLLQSRLTSPCVDADPEMRTVGPDHEAACHRVDGR
ncbi:MAG: ABC transporter ATP-binding protein [Halanaeroarchaeum sp.]